MGKSKSVGRSVQILTVIGCLGIGIRAEGQCEYPLGTGGAALSDNFGVSISVSGDWAIVGANLNDQKGTNAGSAYIFHWNGTAWGTPLTVTAPDGAAYDNFGMAVAMDSGPAGTRAVVVAPGKFVGGVQTGGTYIYTYSGSSWNLLQPVILPVGLSGTSDAISASASISGNVIVVGASLDGTRAYRAGAARVFQFNGSTWVQTPTLFASDAAGADFFGYSVAAFGDWVVVGAFGDDDAGRSNVGSAYTFRRSDNGTPTNPSDDVWLQQQKIIPADGLAYNYFGKAVAIESSTLVIGADQDSDLGLAFGSAYVYHLNGSSWVYEDELHGTGSSTNGFFGSAVAVAGDIIVVGAPKEDPYWNDGGSAHLYRFDGARWHEEVRLEDPDAYANNFFGAAVAAAGSNSFVGAYKALGKGTTTAYDGSCLLPPLCVLNSDCEDSNPCTTDTCSDGVCTNLAVADGTVCTADANSCTNDVCSAGTCTHPYKAAGSACGSSAVSACDNADTCNGSGVCQANNVANGTACTDDGNACTSDSCNAGACAHPFKAAGSACGSSAVSACDNADTCNGSGVCQANNVANGTACTDDGNACTSDSCNAGACAHPFKAAGTACGSSAVSACDNADTCNSTGVCQANNVANGTACNDGLFCNGADSCSAGACSVHAGNPCPGADGDGNCAESCNETSDNCTALDPNGSACNDGLYCNGADSCSGGACSVHAGNPCPGADGDGNCAESCNETVDSCTAADPNGSTCNDGVYCNGADTCSAGACSVHVGNPCPGADGDGNCAESCNETADNCSAADPNGSACNDGLYCNGSDTCSAGACGVHLGNPCPGADGDGNCAESCNETLDNCLLADPNGSACNDGNASTINDQCSAGVCGGTPAPNCDDGNPCTTDSLSGTTCLHTAVANGTACNDGLYCNGADTCSSGACSVHAGNPCTTGPVCANVCNETADNCFTAANTACTADTSPCTNDVCNGSGLCTHPAVANGTVCNDGLYCNGADTCNAGACSVHAGNPCPGPDGDVNCAESCNETSDNCSAVDPDGTSCGVGATCQGGLCFVPNPCNFNGVCNAGEDCNNCPEDCSGATCGDGVCDAYAGEDCVSCAADCRGKQSGPLNKQFCCGDGDGTKPASCASSTCNIRSGGKVWSCEDVPPPCP